MNRIFIASALAALASAPPSLASAQSTDEERKARAQEAFDRGAAFYVEGNYGRALVEFKKANRALPNPMFVVNMALTNGKLGNYADALEGVEAARAMGGLSPDAVALVDGASAAWSIRIRAAAAAEERESLASRGEELDAPIVPQPVESGGGVVGTLGIVSLSLAAAAGVGTAAHYLTVFQPARLALEDSEGSDPSVVEARFDEAQSQQAVGQILLFSSIGLGVLGGALLLVDSSSSTESARVTPLLGPGVAGARVDFTF